MKWKFGKKLLGILAVGAMAIGSVPMLVLPASAESYTYEDLTYKFLKDGTIEITGCSEDENATNVEIPAEIDGVAVTRIGDQAFKRCSLTSITIPEGVTSIGFGAFQTCINLTSITIPSSVTDIEFVIDEG